MIIIKNKLPLNRTLYTEFDIEKIRVKIDEKKKNERRAKETIENFLK